MVLAGIGGIGERHNGEDGGVCAAETLAESAAATDAS
jgi:hypothetical protein